MKKALHIIKIIIVLLVATVAAALIALQSPAVQTKVAGSVAQKLSESIDGEVHFDKIHLKPFTTLIIRGLVIVDKSPYTPESLIESPGEGQPPVYDVDTLFRADYVSAKFSLKSLIGREGVHFAAAKVSDAAMNLVIEDNRQVNLTRMFGLGQTEKKPQNDKEIFSIRDVCVENMDFHMFNHSVDRSITQGAYSPNGKQLGIDWNDMEVRNICIDASGMRFKGGIMSGIVHSLSFGERSGFVCEKISGDTRVGRGSVIINDLLIDDEWSELHLPLFRMDFESSKDFSDFINKVKLTGEIRDSRISFNTISYFAPVLKGNDLMLSVNGNVEGCVNDLHFKDIDYAMTSGGFRGRINGSLSGIPDTEKMYFDCTLKRAVVTSKGLERFVGVWTQGNYAAGNKSGKVGSKSARSKGSGEVGDKSAKSGEFHFSDYGKGLIFNVDSKVTGYLNNLKIVPNISSFAGNVSGNFHLNNITSPDKAGEVNGVFHTKNLDIGKIGNIAQVGECTLDTGLKLTLGHNDEPLSVRIDSLFVQNIRLLNYSYSNLAAAGNLSQNGFDGKIICSDPSLNFLFQGIFAPSKSSGNSVYKFYANLGYADLHSLGFDKRGKSRLRFRTSANFYKTNEEDILGHIDIDDIIVENREGVHDLGRINVSSIMNDITNRILLNSDFLNASFTGTGSIIRFISDLKNLIVGKELPAITGEQEESGWSGKKYRMAVNFRDSRDVLAYALPGLYIADSTSFSLDVSDKGQMRAKFNSQRVAFNDKYFKDIKMDMDNSDGNISGTLRCNEVSIGAVNLGNNSLRVFADDNHIGLGYTFSNDGDDSNRGEFYALGDIDRNEEDDLGISVHILPSAVYFNSREWNILESSLDWHSGRLGIESLAANSGDQSIHLSGGLSKESADTLTLNMDRFDISMFNPVITPYIGLKGAATGVAKLTSPLEDKGLLLDFICDSTMIYERNIGVLYAHTDWNKEFSRFDINVNNLLDGESTINGKASYTPSIRNLDADVEFKGADVGYAQPFLVDIFDNMEGKVYGTLSLEGPVDNLNISTSDTRVEDAWVNVAYINVPYNVSGPFHLDNFGGHFDNVQIKDRFGAKGNVNGAVTYDHFRNLGLDIAIRVDEMEAMNLDEKMNPDFYGRLFATGNLAIHGPMNSIHMDIDAVTAKQGQLHIPIPNTTNAGSTNLLNFKKKETTIKIDPYELLLEKYRKKQAEAAGNLSIKLHVGASPAVEAFLEIDKESGNVLSARGNGVIDLEVTPDVFSIIGDYTITSGNYKFVALGLASRDFSIKEGSTVRFNGDIFESNLNIDATYRTKASVSTLISDDNSVGDRRIVDCGIKITDKLSNPRLAFFIDIPDLDPAVKSRVENALSTEDKVQKQFLSLIISNNFLPDEQSGIFNNSTMLYSNVSEIMANQLNNIFDKLDIPVDLGLNYKPNKQGNDIFDVAVSTRLFNNRVNVNGNIGNRQYSTSGSNSDVVGDLDIEIKLDKKGNVRLNLFSHSADQYTNYLDYSQRNGVGIVYQKEFNKLTQLFRSIFASKEKRKQANEAEDKAMIDGEKTVITVGDGDNGRIKGNSGGKRDTKSDGKTGKKDKASKKNTRTDGYKED